MAASFPNDDQSDVRRLEAVVKHHEDTIRDQQDTLKSQAITLKIQEIIIREHEEKLRSFEKTLQELHQDIPSLRQADLVSDWAKSAGHRYPKFRFDSEQLRNRTVHSERSCLENVIQWGKATLIGSVCAVGKSLLHPYIRLYRYGPSRHGQPHGRVGRDC